MSGLKILVLLEDLNDTVCLTLSQASCIGGLTAMSLLCEDKKIEKRLVQFVCRCFYDIKPKWTT